MKIGYKTIKYLEIVSRIDKYARIAFCWLDMTVFIRSALYCSAACRSYTDNSVSIGFSPVDLISSILIYYIVFRMHVMICDIINLYGSECSKADMERDVCYIYSHVFNFLY